jgi:hypothetical protein
MSQTHKLLLLLSVALLVGAEIIKRRPVSEKATFIIGLVEVIIAIGIGIAFGLTKKRDEEQS